MQNRVALGSIKLGQTLVQDEYAKKIPQSQKHFELFISMMFMRLKTDLMHPGAAKFASLVKEYTTSTTYKLFSGDCLNPSELSTTTKGYHMVDILNELDVDCAVYGNHEFDFGIGPLQDAMKKMNFPWLCSNLRDVKTGEILAKTVNANGEATGITKLIRYWNTDQGELIKVGLLGLVEFEWLETLNMISLDELDYEDYVEVANVLVKELQDDNCDIIIALTHMREPNDIRLAREVDGIDLILGGHDHHYTHSVESDVTILKSGSEFREFSTIDVKYYGPHSVVFDIQRHELHEGVKPDPSMEAIVQRYTADLQRARKTPLIENVVPLETRFARVRTQETNFGNFVADCMREMTKSDVALLNSGTFRADRLFYQGNLTLGDLNTILPMMDRVVQLKMPGSILKLALENSVSKYPTTSGRFLQVSGIHFSFQPATEPRIQDIEINGDKLNENKIYSVATKVYVAHGKDGFDMFNDPLVWKQPCASEKDVDNLPVLKYAIIDKLKEMNANGEKFDSKTDRRILNLEKFSHLSPVASSTSAVLQKQTLQ